MSHEPLVLVDVVDRVATITLNDPEVRNALSAPLVAAVIDAMDGAEADDGVGAVVITGTAPAFCAGANLGNLAEASGESLGAIYEGFLRVARSSLPTVAAVNGAAVGAGMNMALGCDVRIAGHRARFDARFLELGIHPGGGHTWMMRRLVGQQAAMAAIVFGEVLDGAEAARVGLAYRCVDDGVLAAAAHAFAAKAAAAPRSLAIRVKQTIASMATVSDHPTAVAAELQPQLWSTRQPWFAERLAAVQSRISSR